MLHQLVIFLFASFYSLLSVAQPVQQPAGVYSGSINLEGRRYAATVTFSETDAVIEHLKIVCPSGLETTLSDAPYTINGTRLNLIETGSLPAEFTNSNTQLEYFPDDDLVTVYNSASSHLPLTLSREVDEKNYPHPSGPYTGKIFVNNAQFYVGALFSQDGSVLESLIIDFHGLEPITASDVSYNMIGTKVDISGDSPLSETFDRLNAELEYEEGIITLKVYGAGTLSVTMHPVSISRLLRR
ncbi:hypothetical protein FOZ62_031444 [Perkinsus olseni]|uniref:Uncharacterized protein n=1 Tax=Perkinsus olseni TaxID=32597 RepID=A0A7J6QKJ1_PEROL|nr:hypothetical protein FOZ62_031444 [Perkinsus olseni]